MKKVKKLVSIILVFLLMISMISAAPITTSAQTGGHTQAEAVAWAQAQVGKALDYDGVYGAQCVDLIAFYYRYLGNTTPGGNARDYCSNALPSGWKRITNSSGFVPQPGDICVWGANAGGNGSYGHVAIYINGNSSRINTVDQNYLNNQKTDYHFWNTAQVTCFIRPDFSPPTGNNPIGGIDGVSSPSLGKITVIGWAYDPDDTTAQIDVHIYVGGPAGSGEKHIVKANTYQKSVDDTYHCGLYHGFFATFDTKKTGNQPIYAYGINIGGGTTNSQLYGVPRTVYINSDTEKPKVSDITVSQISSNGYRVTCRVSDNVGVTSVKFPSWEQHVGASDVKWHEGTLSGDNKIGSCYIPLSEHNNVKGDYITHIYPYDSSGNYCSVSAGNINITDEPLLVYSTEYNGNIYKVFNSGKTWTQAKEWCEKQGGHLATISNSSEWNAVKQALEKYNGVPCWLGAESTSGTWKWVSGESLSFTNWSSGQPDCGSKNEFYLGTFSDTKKWLDCYQWNDYSNDGASRVGGFVCEFEKTIQNTSTTTNPTKPTTQTKPTITETIVTSPAVPATSPITTNPTESKTTVTLAKYSANLYVKGTTTIKPTVKNGKGVTTYRSNNTRVAKVDSRGKVTALKAGTAGITVTNNKVSKVFAVEVLNPKLNKTSVSISRGKSYTLKITGKIGTAKFYTSNKKIAAVNSKGKITVNKKAKRGSTATITVKTNGITLKCKVKVK